MASEKARTLRVAAVQMRSENGRIRANLDRAAPLVEQAVGQGARLVLLPELMPTGYIYTTAIWDGAEPTYGPTVEWLRHISKRLGVWLGTSFLEADGQHFFNTFVLTTPDGYEAGWVRKQTPAAFEAYFFKGEHNPHVIETDLGRIGVGICYENHLAYIPRMMHQQSVDLLLMPHSFPSLPESSVFRPRHIEYYNAEIRDVALRLARMLGVPAVMANKCGPFRSPAPFFGVPIRWGDASCFPGFSSIVDSDGAVKAQLGGEEAVIVDDVTIDPSRKAIEPPQCCGWWAWDGPWSRNNARLIQAMGRLRYNLSSERRRRARAVSGRAT